jgi:transcriptional regulator with XRE-family HTH domain
MPYFSYTNSLCAIQENQLPNLYFSPIMSNLTKYREKLNLTQDQLADKTGLSVRTIQRIEAGSKPKGHSLNVLVQALNVNKEQLIEERNEPSFNYKLIKLINLSSLPFVIIPLANIAIPLLIMYYKKEVNSLTKQVISVQILWTILSTVLFLLSPFISRIFSSENKLTLIVLIISILTNIFIILRNAIALDKKNKMHIKLNFSFL